MRHGLSDQGGDPRWLPQGDRKLLLFRYLGSRKPNFSATKRLNYVSNVITRQLGSEVTYGRKVLGC